MKKPRILDLFCCAGGAAKGYVDAGFEVVGVDIAPQPNYPYEFVQANALEYLTEHGHEFDAHHASPPCQGYSTITPDHSKHPRLINPVRALLIGLGKPYVIENVEGARTRMLNPTRLCGSSFGLGVRRHRYFETSFPLIAPPCDHRAQGQPIGVYGQHPDTREYLRPDGTRRGNKARSVEQAGEAMGIDWMTWPELAECIPPVYTEYIGKQMITLFGATWQVAQAAA